MNMAFLAGLPPEQQQMVMSQLLMGLGGRLMQPAYSGSEAFSRAGLGLAGDLGRYTAAARAAAERKQIMDMRQRQMEEAAKRQLELEKLSASITGAPRGTYSTAVGDVPGDAFMPGQAYHPAISPETDMRGLAQRFISTGTKLGEPSLVGAGLGMMQPPKTRERRVGVGTIAIEEWNPTKGEWVQVSTAPDTSGIRTATGLTGTNFYAPALDENGNITMRQIGGQTLPIGQPAAAPPPPPAPPAREPFIQGRRPDSMPTYVQDLQEQAKAPIERALEATAPNTLQTPQSEIDRLKRELETIQRMTVAEPVRPREVLGFRIESDQDYQRRKEEAMARAEANKKLAEERLKQIRERLNQLGAM